MYCAGRVSASGGGMSPPGGSASRGVSTPREGVSALGGGCLLPGMGGGWAIPVCTEADPPPANRMTDRCKNITLPQTSFAGSKY